MKKTVSEREAIREESGLEHRERQPSVQVQTFWNSNHGWGGSGGAHWEMIVKLWKGKTEPALWLSWKECPRLGKPQVYGPGSDNSHDRVVKTAPRVRWQGWQKRFITEDSLSAKDAVFLNTPPGSCHRRIPQLRGGTYMQEVGLVQSLTARKRWDQSGSALR